MSYLTYLLWLLFLIFSLLFYFWWLNQVFFVPEFFLDKSCRCPICALTVAASTLWAGLNVRLRHHGFRKSPHTPWKTWDLGNVCFSPTYHHITTYTRDYFQLFNLHSSVRQRWFRDSYTSRWTNIVLDGCPLLTLSVVGGSLVTSQSLTTWKYPSSVFLFESSLVITRIPGWGSLFPRTLKILIELILGCKLIAETLNASWKPDLGSSCSQLSGVPWWDTGIWPKCLQVVWFHTSPAQHLPSDAFWAQRSVLFPLPFLSFLSLLLRLLGDRKWSFSNSLRSQHALTHPAARSLKYSLLSSSGSSRPLFQNSSQDSGSAVQNSSR